MPKVDESELDRRVLDAQWKSDVDSKLDRLLSFSQKYEHYLELALEGQIQRKKIRDAIIEKSLAALIVAAIVGSVTGLWTYARAVLK